MEKIQLQVITGSAPTEVVQYAANQLISYVDRLFHIRSIIVPTPTEADAAIFLDAKAANMAPPDQEQTLILRRFRCNGKLALAAIGGSDVATMWAVYDLVERWGVRYLLRGDVFPASPGPFHLPEVNVVCQPNLRFRGARIINLFPMGPESWGLADIKRFIDQLAKLKFNSVYHQLWCWQPYVHYESRGITKSTGIHWFGWHYPIDENTIGRHLFHSQSEFVPPDFENCRTYQDRIKVGQHIVRESLAHARRRGFQTQISTVLTDFPIEFGFSLGRPPLASLHPAVSGGHKGADDMVFQEMCATALRAYIDTYPEVDSYVIGMPEFRLDGTPYKAAWKRLDSKYDFRCVRRLEQVLEQAATRTDFPGGPARVEQAVKGDIVALDLFDRLLNEQRILDDCTKPDADVHFTGVSEELVEVYNQMFSGVHFPCSLDYTSSRMAKRPHAFARIKKAGLRPILIMTAQDDNIGVIPQLSTTSIHELMNILCRCGWEGFQLRYWMTSDMEPTMAYLSKAAWDESVSPESAYRDHVKSLCGEAVEDDLVECFKILDQITIGLGDHALGISFPVPNTAIDHWYAGGRLSDKLDEDRRQYHCALQKARNARSRAIRGYDYLDCVIGRLEFGIGYIDMIESLKRGGEANMKGEYKDAITHLERALEVAKRIVSIHADITHDATGLGTLAQLNEDLCRKLSRLLDAVRTGKKWARSAETGGSSVLVS